MRHGSPVGGRRYRGHGVDDPLSEKGWQQMENTAAAVSGWQRIISSPMQRCSAFAEKLANERNIPMHVENELREVGFGAWEGLSPDDIKQNRGTEYQDFYEDPVNNRPVGAEPLGAFANRIANAIDKAAKEYEGEHLLIVCHAGVMRATLGNVMSAPPVNWYRARVDNAAILRMKTSPYGLQLIHHNWLPGEL